MTETIENKIPENKTPDMPEKKYIPLEDKINKYEPDLPTDLQQFYKTLPAAYQPAFTQIYTAYKAAGFPNPEKEAVKVMGAMMCARMLDTASDTRRYSQKMAEKLAADILQNLGYHATEIKEYFQRTEPQPRGE